MSDGIVKDSPRGPRGNKSSKVKMRSSFGKLTTKALSDRDAAQLSGRIDIATKERMKKNLNLARGNGILPNDAAQASTLRKLSVGAFVPPNLEGREAVLVVIDVETTGLSRHSSRIIQLAAKVLGSVKPEDSFSAYVCPPRGELRSEVEILTGITDKFLRNGGMDASTGIFHGPAPSFDLVYTSFCKWCKDRAGGKRIVLLAHNAKFDVGILNSEIKRLGTLARQSRPKDERCVAGSSKSLPMLGKDAGIASFVDTLMLLRSKSLWSSKSRGGETAKLPRPPSFKQADVYQHLIGSPMPAAHNAMGDVIGLEAILCSYAIKDHWIQLAQKIQTPLVVIQDEKSNDKQP